MTLDPQFLTQYSALTGGVGFAALPGRTILSLAGNDRVSFLNAFCTNNIKALTPGRGCEAFITSPQGKTLGHVFVFCEPDQLMLDTSPGQAAPLIEHLSKYIISEDVEFVDHLGKLFDVLVTGPDAAQLLAQVGGANPPTALFDHATTKIADVPVTIRRVEYAGPHSYFVQVPVDHLSAATRALVAAGGMECDAAAIESARLEAGFPLFGLDISPENLPQEIGRDAQAISFTKGCYLGQETVARLDALGHVNRLLVGLKFSGDTVPTASTPLLATRQEGGQEVGHVNSAAWSPALAAPLAFALLRRQHARPGTQLASASGPAEVIKLPVGSS